MKVRGVGWTENKNKGMRNIHRRRRIIWGGMKRDEKKNSRNERKECV